MLSLDDVTAAAGVLDGVAHRTPVLTSRTLDARTGARVRLKHEAAQRTGSFKFRGAYHAVATLDPAERARGVATFSSGNHGQALALAAALHDVPATVLAPADAAPAKLAAMRGYGAKVRTYDRYTEDREALGRALAAERGAVVVPPYDDEAVMAGQGTAALELLADSGDVDVLVVCVGGGGLIAGCATAAKALVPGCAVVGVEPESGDDVARSLRAGRIVSVPVPRTIADGQQTTAPGRRTFPVIAERVDRVVTVSDAEILDAMAFAFTTLKVVLEPSGASALAALLTGRLDVVGLRVGVTLSGGNVSLDRFVALLAAHAPASYAGPVPSTERERA